MREALLRAGFNEAASRADWIIVNSCTVTRDSDRKTFYYMRRFRKANPRARIILAGCVTEKNSTDELLGKGADIIIRNTEKRDIARLIQQAVSPGRVPDTPQPLMNISFFKGHTRAFIKIQDGCGMRCSYCKVTLVRGESRSRDSGAVVEEAGRLAANGYKEIVLTGVQLGAFGKERGGESRLGDLLSRLARVPGLERIRLSSIEPFDMPDDVIEALCTNPLLCPHLHLPLQSGDDSLLRRMRRPYTAAHYIDLINRICARVPRFGLTTDVIVGFPGETEEAFENTKKVLELTRPFKIHIFPFSPREGTEAYGLEGRVPSSVIKKREKELSALNDELFRSTSLPLTGTRARVLVEKSDILKKRAEGRLSDYRSARISGYQGNAGDVADVTVTGIARDHLVAEA